jgi:hypothetical protein
MTGDKYQPVAVSRRICAPAHDIFQVLASPGRHREFDGSQMVRGAVSSAVISAAGDVFVMKMYYSGIGDYEMNNHMVEYEQDRQIGWEPEAGRGHPGAAPGSLAPARWGWCLAASPRGLCLWECLTGIQRRWRSWSSGGRALARQEIRGFS